MPALTDIQSYAADILRTLRCVRRGHIHWMIGRKFPFVTPEKIMRQLAHVLRVYDDGEYYRWPGTEPDPERAAAVEVMLKISGGGLPIIAEAPRYPCALLFFVPARNPGTVLAYRVYTPKIGEETECRVKAESERQPKGHAVVFVISGKGQISLLRVSHPHIFALAQADGAFEFLEAKVN